MSDQKQASLLLAKWDQLRGKGNEMTPEELCRDQPELLPTVKRNIDAIRAMEERYPDADSTEDGQTNDYHTSDDSSFAPPPSAGRYKLQQEIARGGMGAVLRAVDSDFDRDLAVKVMLSDPQKRPDFERRFQEEARITGRLQHPGIPPVHEKGCLEDGRPFFAMKLIEGKTLAELLKGRKPTDGGPWGKRDLPRFMSIFEQICQTLAYTHSRGVIHRDLKPANIMVGAFGEVQVMDWGLAKVVCGQWSVVSGSKEKLPTAIEDPVATLEKSLPSDKPQTTDHGLRTRAGAVMGTPAYMAPEQARGEIDRLDEQSDVFGLGGILCAILTEQPPFAGGGVAADMRAAIHGDLAETYDRLDRCGADAELVRLAKQCLAPKQSDRPPHAGAVAQAVSAYLQSVQEKLRRAEVERAEAQVKAIEEKRRRKWTLATAAALVLLSAGGVAGAFWYQQVRYQESLRQTKETADSLNDMKQSREKAEILTEDLSQRRQHLDAAQAEQTQLKETLARLNSAQSPLLSRQFQEEKTRLQNAEKDHHLLTAFEQLETKRIIFESKQSRQQFETAFKEFEKELNAYCSLVSSEQAVALVRSRPKEMQRRLKHILHICYAELCKTKDANAGELRIILDKVDSQNAWRREVRKAMVIRDVAGLTHLAKQTEAGMHDATVLYVLSQRLPARERIALLRRGQKAFPQDFWINHELARTLQRYVGNRHSDYPEDKKTLLYDAIRFFAAAAVLRPNNFKVLLNYGTALQIAGRFSEALDVWEKASELNPKYAEAHYNLGVALLKMGKNKRAGQAFTEAIRCNRKFAKAYYNLAVVKVRTGNAKEAIPNYNKSLELDPNYVVGYYGRAGFWYSHGKLDRAIDDYKKAIELFPEFDRAYRSLAFMYYQRSLSSSVPLPDTLNAALAAARKAAVLNPSDSVPYSIMGLVFAQQGKLDAALHASAVAIHLDPRNPAAYEAKGMALSKQSKPFEATNAFARAVQLRSAHDYLRPSAEKQRSEALEKGFAAWQDDRKTSAAELLLLAMYCRHDKKQYRTAAVLYEEAFDAQPSLTADLEDRHRFNAACCAALAAAALHKQTIKPKDSAKDWRKKAHDWLRDDLNAWEKQLLNYPFIAPEIEQLLLQLTASSELKSVRAAKLLAALSEAERQTWTNFWKNVAELQKMAGAKYREIAKIANGELSADVRKKSMDVKLSAGKTYVIDLKSGQFNPLLYLEDRGGVVLSLNDDITIGKNRNSRLVFTPKQDDEYRIVATAFGPNGNGAFTLTTREFAGDSSSSRQLLRKSHRRVER